MASTDPVYIVDDSPEVRAFLTDTLHAMGHEAQAFASGAQALDAISQKHPKLVLIDLRMAPMAGDDLCRKLKENRALSKIPVIIFTSANSALEVMRSWRAGADDFLPKPVTRAQLEAKLSALEQASADESRADGPRRPGEHRRLLFVDDSRFFRTVLGSALEQSGFQLMYARSGPEALQMAQANCDVLDAVVSDLVMPGMDGLQFVSELRTKEGWEHKPVLMMTASDSSADRAQAVKDLTGFPLLDKKLFPVEAIVSKVNAAVDSQVGALRASERVPFFSVVEFRPAGTSDFLSGFSYDVSPGGLFVRSLTPLSGGSAIEMKVKLTARTPVPACFGEVVWANRYHSRTSFNYPFGMGIRFTHLEADQRAEVQKLVRGGGRLIAA